MSHVNKNRVKKLDSPSESILSLHPAGDASLEGKKKKSNHWKELRCPPSRSERSETKCSTMDFIQSCNAPIRSSLSSNNRMHLMIAAACCALEHGWTCCINPDVQRLWEEDALHWHFYAHWNDTPAFITGGFLKHGRNQWVNDRRGKPEMFLTLWRNRNH